MERVYDAYLRMQNDFCFTKPKQVFYTTIYSRTGEIWPHTAVVYRGVAILSHFGKTFVFSVHRLDEICAVFYQKFL